MTSLFGGNPNIAHFVVGVKYLSRKGENPTKAAARRKKQHATLKAAGFKEEYFQFRVTDEEGKAKAKARAEIVRDLWEKKVGFKMNLAEGCFL